MHISTPDTQDTILCTLPTMNTASNVTTIPKSNDWLHANHRREWAVVTDKFDKPIQVITYGTAKSDARFAEVRVDHHSNGTLYAWGKSAVRDNYAVNNAVLAVEDAFKKLNIKFSHTDLEYFAVTDVNSRTAVDMMIEVVMREYGYKPDSYRVITTNGMQ